MNNYWTRTAPVALVYFSEIKRDIEIMVMFYVFLIMSSKITHKPKQINHILGIILASPVLTKKIKITHTFSEIYFSFQCKLLNWALKTLLRLPQCPLPSQVRPQGLGSWVSRLPPTPHLWPSPVSLVHFTLLLLLLWYECPDSSLKSVSLALYAQNFLGPDAYWNVILLYGLKTAP